METMMREQAEQITGTTRKEVICALVREYALSEPDDTVFNRMVECLPESNHHSKLEALELVRDISSALRDEYAILKNVKPMLALLKPLRDFIKAETVNCAEHGKVLLASIDSFTQSLVFFDYSISIGILDCTINFATGHKVVNDARSYMGAGFFHTVVEIMISMRGRSAKASMEPISIANMSGFSGGASHLGGLDGGSNLDDDEVLVVSPTTPTATLAAAVHSTMPVNGSSGLSAVKPRRKHINPRRDPKKWTEKQIVLLKREVRKYGKGHWTEILVEHEGAYGDHTSGDLKDKWRNICARSLKEREKSK